MIRTISRQEVLNIAFAKTLHSCEIVVAPESIIHANGRRSIPDVIVRYRHFFATIEGEIDDQVDAERKVKEAVIRRLEQGIAPLSIGVIYPAQLRNVPFDDLPLEFLRSQLRFTVLTIAQRELRFVQGGLNHLRDVLARAYDHLAHEEEVTLAAGIVDSAVEEFAQTVLGQLGERGLAVARAIAEVLEMPYQPERRRKGKATQAADEADDETEETPLPRLRSESEHYNAVCHIGGLAVMNALIFQELLAQHGQDVKTLTQVQSEGAPPLNFAEAWQHILERINYYPIFHLAQGVVKNLPASEPTSNLLRTMVRAALNVAAMKSALQHDLMGRVYHRLLAQAKYLGAYYTSVPAAILLLMLALNPKRWDAAWHDLDAVRQLRVADLACGSGTLLMAAADVITGNHVEASARMGITPRRADLQKALAEEMLYGYDVLASAVHLTASTLALRAPEQTFERMNLFVLPLGGEEAQLGSLEFANAFQIALPQDLFGSAVQVTGAGEQLVYQAPLPKLDLCVMNPPFVRSSGGNLLFGSLPQGQRQEMQQRLQRLIRQRNLSASITAGLGSVFVAVAHPYIKEGGRIALILPKALLSGVAWAKTRELLKQHYRLEYVVVSHDPEQWNFSYNTELSEVLLVARKVTADESGLPEGERPDLYAIPKPKGNGTPTVYTIRRNPLAKVESEGVVVVNLRRNVQTAMDALVVAWQARDSDHVPLIDGQGYTEISYGEVQLAESCRVPDEVMMENWLLPCAFAQTDLARAAYYLLQGEVWIPDAARRSPIRLCSLGELGVLGPDSRDIEDGFVPSKARTLFAAFWGHDSSTVVTIAQEPNRYLAPRPTPLPGRRLRRAVDLAPQAGRLLIGRRMHLNTQRLFAIYLPRPALSNVWWSFSLHAPNERREKALTLWLNSTLHILLALTARVETRGAWVKFNKPTLAALPVLDVRLLTEWQLDVLTQAYDELCQQTLEPFPKMEDDSVRIKIDKAVSEALGLPDLGGLRMLLGQEPVISLKRL